MWSNIQQDYTGGFLMIKRLFCLWGAFYWTFSQILRDISLYSLAFMYNFQHVWIRESLQQIQTCESKYCILSIKSPNQCRFMYRSGWKALTERPSSPLTCLTKSFLLCQDIGDVSEVNAGDDLFRILNRHTTQYLSPVITSWTRI